MSKVATVTLLICLPTVVLLIPLSKGFFSKINGTRLIARRLYKGIRKKINYPWFYYIVPTRRKLYLFGCLNNHKNE